MSVVSEAQELLPQELVRIEDLSKTFNGVRVLDSLRLSVSAGEVHALLGHNGSGKSTTIKILSGYHKPDPGARLWVRGEEVGWSDLGDSRRHVRFVHQDPGLVRELTVAENFGLLTGFSSGPWGALAMRQQRRRTAEVLERFAISLTPDTLMSDAAPVQRMEFAISAALHDLESGGLLVLDEPTALLPPSEVSTLLATIRRLRSAGNGIILVSHRLADVVAVADRVTVLRDGRHVASQPLGDMGQSALISLMFGESAGDARPAQQQWEDNSGAGTAFDARPGTAFDAGPATVLDGGAGVAFEVEHLSGRRIVDLSFAVGRGELIGLIGAPESGTYDVSALLWRDRSRGVGGRVRTGTAQQWTELRRWDRSGVAYLPADRLREGIIGPMSNVENMMVQAPGRGLLQLLRRSHDLAVWNRWAREFAVEAAGPDQPVQSLSGGNQQKVVLGRLMEQRPEVLLLCEPTAGVDVNARRSIVDRIHAQAGLGLAGVVVSSDTNDYLDLCTRVLVIREGCVVEQLTGESLNETALHHAMQG